MRQLLTESLLQAAIGAGLGVLASYGILTGIRVLLPPYAFAPEVVIRINIPVLLFSIGVGLATGVLFGLWPALQLSRTPAGQLMGSNVRRFTGSVAGRRDRKSTRLNSSHSQISYAVFCLKKKMTDEQTIISAILLD